MRLRKEPYASREISLKELVLCSTQNARKLLTYEQAISIKSLPLGIHTRNGKSVITVAISKESARDALSALRFITNYEVRPLLVPEKTLLQATFESYKGDGEILTAKAKELPSESAGPNLQIIKNEADETNRFLTALLDYSFAKQASDIHILPLNNGSLVKIRVNGELLTHEQSLGSRATHAQIVRRLKIMSSLDPSRSDQASDGSFIWSTHENQVSVRLSTIPTIHGEKISLRLFGTRAIISLGQLVLDPLLLKNLQNILNKRQGGIIVSGPTGSGKTTLLYSLLSELKEQNLNIFTLEDPVEASIAGTSQTSINSLKGFTFEEGLKSLLRQDPDVIMVGEIRDSSTAIIAAKAALTGHLLLSTVHARDTFESIHRLLSLKLEPIDIAYGLSMLISTRLLHKLCDKCKVIDLEASNRYKASIFREVGCAACDYTGVQSRLLLTESLTLSKRIGELVLRGKVTRELLAENYIHDEYQPFYLNALEMLKRGEISENEYLKIK